MRVDIVERDLYDPESIRLFTDNEILSDSQMHSDNVNNIKMHDLITLKNIELEIAKGEFVAIVGEIRSGKSSFLSSIIGDMLYVNEETMNEFENFEIFRPSDDIDQHRKAYLLSMNNKNYKDFSESCKNQSIAPVIHISGSVSYVQQHPWILNQTVKDNILFGNKEEKDRYIRTFQA